MGGARRRITAGASEKRAEEGLTRLMLITSCPRRIFTHPHTVLATKIPLRAGKNPFREFLDMEYETYLGYPADAEFGQKGSRK